jgi:endonuclease/exonuclease/phosphatase family metal-dependent hydrolase
MRMATFNILHGRSVHDGEVDVDRLTECVRRLNADVDGRGGRRTAWDGRLRDCAAVAVPRGVESHPVRRLARDLRGFPGPRVLMGDLTTNALGRWARLRPLAAAPTFPADAPDHQIDHILTDDDLTAEGFSTPRLSISDHRPLVIDVTRASGGKSS